MANGTGVRLCLCQRGVVEVRGLPAIGAVTVGAIRRCALMHGIKWLLMATGAIVTPVGSEQGMIERSGGVPCSSVVAGGAGVRQRSMQIIRWFGVAFDAIRGKGRREHVVREAIRGQIGVAPQVLAMAGHARHGREGFVEWRSVGVRQGVTPDIGKGVACNAAIVRQATEGLVAGKAIVPGHLVHFG